MFKKKTFFIRRKIRYLFKNFYKKKDIAISKDKPFVIICNNCWGGALYRWYNRPYNSPFVGLFLYGPCYIKLLKKFEYYMQQELQFISTSIYPERAVTYPIARLGDVEIHFTHYESEYEARAKWERRTSRMLKEKNSDNYFFKVCDREQITKKHLIEFHKLPFKNKISFAINNYSELEHENHIKIYESHKNNKKFVPNGKKLFKLTFIYFKLNNWLFR